jgi:hypothetical protein
MCCRIRVFLIIIIIFLSLQKLGPPNYSYGPWWTKTLIYIYIYIYIFFGYWGWSNHPCGSWGWPNHPRSPLSGGLATPNGQNPHNFFSFFFLAIRVAEPSQVGQGGG